MRIPHSLLLPIAIAAASQLGATDCGSVIRDDGFDLWCGDDLCVWKVVRGDVMRVPTWHEGDDGVEFVGDDVAITQLSPVNSGDSNATCIQFEMVANVESKAEAFLELDLEADGAIDLMERIPTTKWESVAFAIPIDPPYDGIRFTLVKRGAGTAVLAQIEARTSEDACEGLPPIDPGPRPNGARCFDGSDCMSGLCLTKRTLIPDGDTAKACAGCDPDAAACGAGEVCGLAETSTSILAIPLACVPAAGKDTGEQCITGDECASSICFRPSALVAGACSACDAGTTCPNGLACATGWGSDGDLSDALRGIGIGPRVCGPGSQMGAPGAACTQDADCASNRCAGTERRACSDGRACISIADCPVKNALEPGACTIVGVQGGSCE
jgi:hypothetical protein